MSQCPPPSVLEAFASGNLRPEERDRAEIHFDQCDDCAATVAEFGRLFGSASMDLGPDPQTLGHASRLQQTTAASVVGHTTEAGRHAPPPATAGRYRLGERLGSGGMGIVFAAEDPELHRRVAVKLLHPSAAADPDATRARLLREARAMARLAHPNVVAIHDVGRVGEQVFVAMELVEGATLTRWLAAQQRTQAEILAVFAAAGAGLHAAHEVGLAHRDFKPDNVLIGSDGRARVTDFGLATPLLSWSAQDSTPEAPYGLDPLRASVSIATEHGAIVGTPAYMAPEQWRAEAADARSDQFSFCVALYEALLAKRPFAGADWITLSQNVLAGQLPSKSGLPSWLDRALRRGLATSPDQRHRSMQPLLSALTRDRTTVLRVAAIAGGIGFAAAAAVGVFAWMAGQSSLGTAAANDDPAGTAAAPSDPAVAADSAAVPNDPANRPDVGIGTDPAQACEARYADASGFWTAKRKQTLRGRLERLDGAPEVLELAVPALDRWAERYAAVGGVACDPSRALQPERVECLADHVARLDALLSRAVTHHTFRVVETLAHAAASLPAPETCEDDALLRARGPVVPDDLVGKATMVRSSIAGIEADLALMQLVAAEGSAKTVVDDATALGHAPLLAQAELAAGEIELEAARPDKAAVWFERAAATAERGGCPLLSGRAANGLVVATGVDLQRPIDAARWQTAAGSVVDRIDAPRLAAAKLLADGKLLRSRLELRAAIDVLGRALTEHEAVFGSGTVALAPVYLELSKTHHAFGDAVQAEAHARAAEEVFLRVAGPRDRRAARAATALARAFLLAGKLDKAHAAATRAEALAGSSNSLRQDFDRGDALLVLGQVEVAQDNAAGALATFKKAEIYHYTGVEKAEPLLARGNGQLEAGAVEDGVASLEAAVAELDSQLEGDDPRKLEVLRGLGRGLLQAGRHDNAREVLERAQSIARTNFGFGAMTARSTFDLAELERAAGNPKLALELFDDAHVPWVGGFGMDHPSVTVELLARADLAFELGQSEYAERLYSGNTEKIAAVFGENSPEAKRSRTREGK